MTTSSEESVKSDDKSTQAPRRSRHRSRHRLRIAARLLLALGILVGGLAVSNFAYNAYLRADCLTGEEVDDWGFTKPPQPKSEPCGAELVGRDELLRLDSTAALIAIVILIGSTMMLRRVRKHRR